MDGFMKALIADAMSKARSKDNIIVIACDNYKDDGTNCVGVVAGDAVSLAYAICRLVEKEKFVLAILETALDTYKKSELQNRKN